MNIEQAKCIPMSSILEKINCHPVKYSEKEAWYRSPLRQEKTASFQVLYKTNRWHDFGEGIGGDTIDFVRAYLNLCEVNDSIPDALRWINNMVGNTAYIAFVPHDVAGNTETDKSLIRNSVEPIKHRGLINYIERRGIDFKLAKSHLKQLSLTNKKTDKKFYALGLKNEENGYEIRNPYFKGCAGKKHITFIRGTKPKPDDIHLFEGMFDYLTYLTIKKQHEHDVIILNSLSCLKFATPYIKGYGYKKAATWLDNDLSGQKATEVLAAFFKTEDDLIHKPMNSIYENFKDVNAWHMHNLNLS
ncbi:toprim domain-containing protein [Mucilaginibacter ginsenosidivorax]|uniref:Zinc finger CHC2-type domain-containing protein n=1 Tax=Mucilaginibacter ginsenosidivorax TaxID=862126 RepID=A0A5B8W793_9SPHI|nr:toprim domain-containing protein [Mucilaginibacter ginsenosidivorax]QEC79347.1 hypothetical protein FSB76_26610 [Mucilaginibacter ginsenosidivorax]